MKIKVLIKLNKLQRSLSDLVMGGWDYFNDDDYDDDDDDDDFHYEK